jgi:C-terminal processing protease CtpA/Prc
MERLDRAVGDLQTVRGLIVDVRGNTGGGFDADRALLNFTLDKPGVEPNRPRFRGPMALLIDEACISAGEGWASWFLAQHRARIFGRTTAGASSRKIEYTLKNGLYRVSLPVKAYTGYLDRPIESRGLEPDVPILPKAEDIAHARDTVLLAAQSYLLTQKPDP